MQCTNASDSAMIRASFAKLDYTPGTGEVVGSLWDDHRAESVEWPLCARLALFDGGGESAALVLLDQAVLTTPTALEFRKAVSAGANIPLTHIMAAPTHTHTSLRLRPYEPDDSAFERIDAIGQKLFTLAKETSGRLRPVRLSYGCIDAPGWSFNRRPVYRAPDGREQVGTHGPRGGKNFLRMEGPDEKEVAVLLATGADGEPVGGIVNFACHPTTRYGANAWSADFPGALVQTLEDRYGGVFIYVNGACGDLSNVSGIPGKSSEISIEHCSAMGKGLAEKVEEAIAPGRECTAHQIRAAGERVSIAQRRVTQGQLDAARECLTALTRKEPWPKMLALELYGYEYHFYAEDAKKAEGPEHSEHLAREIIGMWEWQKRVGTRELREDLEVQVIAIGDTAFVGFPAELFSAFGRELRAKSSFPATFVVGLANGHVGYVPTLEAFEHGGHEVCLKMGTRLVPEAGRLLTEAALRILARVREKETEA